MLQKVMHANTKVVMQSTSPLSAKESFWVVNHTIQSSGLTSIPYHTYVPSFGEWGFILFGHQNDFKIHRDLPNNLKYYSQTEFQTMRFFPMDMRFETKVVNRLENQILISIFEREWGALF
jgi:spermidine synthase